MTKSHLAESALRVDTIRVLLAVRTDMALLLTHEACGVRKLAILLFRLGTCSQSVLGRPTVEADARVRLSSGRKTFFLIEKGNCSLCTFGGKNFVKKFFISSKNFRMRQPRLAGDVLLRRWKFQGIPLNS